jgi:hypothetical protein
MLLVFGANNFRTPAGRARSSFISGHRALAQSRDTGPSKTTRMLEISLVSTWELQVRWQSHGRGRVPNFRVTPHLGPRSTRAAGSESGVMVPARGPECNATLRPSLRLAGCLSRTSSSSPPKPESIMMMDRDRHGRIRPWPDSGPGSGPPGHRVGHGRLRLVTPPVDRAMVTDGHRHGDSVTASESIWNREV